MIDPAELHIARRYQVRTSRFRCPACSDIYYAWAGLKRHMAKLHHACRFCPRAYIRVDQHERRSHTIEWARAAGACLPATSIEEERP